MSDIQTLISKLRTLYLSIERPPQPVHNRNELSMFIAKLKPCYERTTQEAYNKHIVPLLGSNHKKLFTPSVLEILKKATRETYHSLFLSYIWDCGREGGKDAFCDFLECTPKVSNRLKALVRQSKYRVYTDKPIKSGYKGRNNKRPDLCFSDNKSWLIIIENKVKADVTKKGRQDSQITQYRKLAEECYPNYFKCYILLSEKDNKEYLKYEPTWHYCDYLMLLKSLLKAHTKDRVTEDYISTLLGFYKDKRKIQNAPMSLYNIEKLKLK